jgi:hypothetical protein
MASKIELPQIEVNLANEAESSEDEDHNMNF